MKPSFIGSWLQWTWNALIGFPLWSRRIPPTEDSPGLPWEQPSILHTECGFAHIIIVTRVTLSIASVIRWFPKVWQWKFNPSNVKICTLVNQHIERHHIYKHWLVDLLDALFEFISGLPALLPKFALWTAILLQARAVRPLIAGPTLDKNIKSSGKYDCCPWFDTSDC